MKKLILFLAILVGFAPAETVFDGGRTTIVDTVRWGDADDSTSYLLTRKTAKFRDSASTWRSITGSDSCSLPVRVSIGSIFQAYKYELSYEVRSSSGNTDSNQIKLRIDSRYCKETGRGIDSLRCESWVAAGRYRGDTSSFVMDSIITIATTSGTTWKPSRQLFDVPGGSQIRFCVDGFKTGAQTNDSTFFRRFVVRTSSVPAGGIPPSAVSISGVSLGTVDVSSSALPTGAATATNQTGGSQKTQIVDGSANVIGSTSNALDVNIKSGSSSGAVAQGSTTSGQTGSLTQAAVTTAAPSYTTGQTSPLSLTTGGALRVDASAQTLTVGSHAVTNAGTFATQSAQSGTWNITNVSGTVSLPTGASTAAKQPALGTAGTASSDVITVQGIASMTALKVDPSAVTSPISAASLPLPSGAATAAKQPALGTAGSSSTDVLSVQGIASGTAMPVSAASLPLPSGAATSANQSTEITSLGTIAALSKTEDAAHSTGDPGIMPLAVRRDANTTLADATGDYAPLQVDASGSLKVAITAGAGSGGTSIADDAAFTNASTSVTPVAGVYNSTLGTVADGAASALAITPKGSLMVNLRDASGTEVSVGGGTQYDDDAVYAGDGAKVTMAGVVRRDANTTLAGADGDVAPLQVNAAGALKVDASGAAVPITDNSGSLTVDYATTGSGTATGALRVELPTNGTGVIGTVGAVTAITNALPAGTNAIGKLAANSGVDIGDVDVTSVSGTVTVGGVAATDAAVSGNPVYTAGRASAAAPTDMSADGDVTPSWYLRNGAQATVLTAAGALIGGDATNGLDVDITRNAALVAGSAVIGKVGIDQTTPGTTNLVALAANQSVNVAQINGVTTLMGNGVTGTGSQRVTIASDNTAFSVNATAVGQAAHDAAIAGNPVRAGARAVTADYTAVASGDQADLISTIDGKLVVKPHAVRGATWTYAAASGGITNTTAATMKAAAGAGVRACLTGIQVINSHATVSTEVVVRDGASGTVLHRGYAQAAGGGYAANFDVPICGTANTLMEVADITTGAAVYVNAQGYTSQE